MSDLSQLRIESMRNRVSREEWDTRVDLAACYRLVHHYGMDDLVYNHISARVPGEEGHFLINAYGMTYDEITASSLVKIDFDGNVVQDSGTGYGINQAGFVIHSAVHKGRPDVGCVIHTHSVAGMAVSALDCGLLPITQTAMYFDGVGMHEYESVAIDLDEHLQHIEDLIWPSLFIIGGGVSKNGDKFIPRLERRTSVVAAKLRNDAGIIGAAIVGAEGLAEAATTFDDLPPGIEPEAVAEA